MNESLRIAVADDEPDMRDYYARILPRLGHRVVVVASTGAELLSRSREAHPDLIITDVRMPDMDGIEAANRLAREEAVPVVLVSAYHDRELTRAAESGHVVGCLVKPIRQADLAPAIDQARRRFEERRQTQT